MYRMSSVFFYLALSRSRSRTRSHFLWLRLYLSLLPARTVALPRSLLSLSQPENLLYASEDPKSPDYNTIKVADFGLSKFVSENSQMKTTCGTVCIVMCV